MSAIFVPRRISQQLDVSFGTVANDDFLQRKSGAWANRTVAQVKADLGLSGTNSGDQTITLTGDVTGTGTGSFAVTLATVTVDKGGTGLSSATAYAVLCGGTTGTGALQSPGTGTAGQILTSGGASALPTWSSSISVTTIDSTGANTNTKTGLGTTTAAAFIAQNITAAAAGAQQISSSVDVVGQGWKTNATAASQEVRGRMNILPVQGAANPTGTLQFQIGINGATPTNVLTVGSDSVVTIGVSGPVLTPNAAATGSLSIKNGATTSVWINANDVRLTSGLTIGWSSDATNSFNGTKDTFLGRQAAANLRQGAADAAAPVAQTFSVQNVSTGTSNTAGADRYYDASQGTGTGAGGSHIFRTAPAGGAGSSQNALAAALTISSVGNITASGSFTSTNGGFIAASGSAFSWSSRAQMRSLADGTVRISDASISNGATLDVTTDGTIKLRDRTNAADATVTAGKATLSGPLITTPQALSGAGAINLTTGTTAFTSTGAAQALTLADGTNGQIKTIVHVADGGSGVLTPTTASGYTIITFANVGDSVTLQFFTTAGWCIVGIFGAVAA